MAETIAERVRKLQIKAAESRAADGTARPTDDLLLNPDGFTKTQAAEIRATQKSKEQGGYSYLNPDSRGSQLSNDSFEETYGKSAYDNLYGVGYAGPADGSKNYSDQVTKETGNAPDYTKQSGVFTGNAPKMGINEDPTAYRMRYLTWERDEARNAFNQTVEITKGVRDASDKSKSDAFAIDQQNKGNQLSGKTTVNPAYTNLSKNEKVLNQQYFEKTGKYLVDPTISAESGRSPINTKQMTRAEKQAQASFNAKMSKIQDQVKRGEIVGPTADMFSAAEAPFLSDYLNYEQTQNAKVMQTGRDEKGVNILGDDLRKLELELGMTDGQELDFDADGTPYIKEDGTKVDPRARAEEKLKAERDDQIGKLTEGYELEKARIENAHRVNGSITLQGKRQLDKLEREYLKDLKKTEDNWDESIEDALLNEDKKQYNVDQKINEMMDPVNVMKVATQNAILREASGLMKSGATSNWTAAISQANSMMATDKKNPTQAEMFKKADAQIFTAGFDRGQAFTTAASVIGYDSKAVAEYMKSRGFTDTDVANQMAEYQKSVLGYTQEQVDAERDDFAISEIIGKPRETLSAEELDFLQQYEIDNPKKAERWKMKILFPEMTDAEIWQATEEKFEKEKPRTVANSKNELFDAKVEEYLAAGKSEQEAYRLANQDVSKTFSTAKGTSTGKDGKSDFGSAENSLETALGKNLITPRQAESYLRENFPDLKQSERDTIEKKFVRYNSSSQQYESMVSENFEMLQNLSKETNEEYQKMTPVERTEFLKFNEDEASKGEFIDGVFMTFEEMKSRGIKVPATRKTEKKETPKETISDEDFGALWDEALGE